jgi:HK97 family phage major capsid protein
LQHLPVAVANNPAAHCDNETHAPRKLENFMSYAQQSYSNRNYAPGERAGRILRCVAASSLLHVSPIDYAERNLGDKLMARTLAAGIASSGGFLTPEELASEVIDLLRPRSVIRSAGPRILPMPSGNMSVGRINVGAQASYVGENQAAATGDETFGQVRLSARKLMARVGISNDLIRFASPQADALVRDDLVKQVAVAEDQAFIRGPGTQFSPKGLRYWAPTANVIPANATINVTNTIADMASLVTALMNASVPMGKPTWLVSQRTWNYLYDARDSVGGFLFRNEMDRGVFRNYPMKWTQNIPQNLGVGANESEVYLVDFDEFMIGEVPGIIVDASSVASYTPDGSTMVSAFDNDQTVIRVIEQHDCAMRHDAAVAVLTGVKWS